MSQREFGLLEIRLRKKLGFHIRLKTLIKYSAALFILINTAHKVEAKKQLTGYLYLRFILELDWRNWDNSGKRMYSN